MTRHTPPAITALLDGLRTGDPDSVRLAVVAIEAADERIRTGQPAVTEPWDQGFTAGLDAIHHAMVNAMHRAGQTLDVAPRGQESCNNLLHEAEPATSTRNDQEPTA